MKKTLMLLITLITLSLTVAQDTLAMEKEPVAGNSAMLKAKIAEQEEDERAVKLEKYLESHNSPLASYADVFVAEADRNGLSDKWAMVAAISGVESTFGKRIPQNSYNAWGWGIPTGAKSGIAFSDWSDGISTVSRDIKTKYIDRGAETLPQIGRIYAPFSNTWARNVAFFMEKIESTELEPKLTI